MAAPDERAAFEPAPRSEPGTRDRTTWLMAPMLLFARPSRFFRLFVVSPAPLLTALFAWLYGAAGVMDRVDSRMAMGQVNGNSLPIADQWGVHWLIFAIGGLLAGALYAGIGGWWYRLRLIWCGVPKPEWAMTRRVYLTASAVFAIPMLLDRLADTLMYARPSDAYAGSFDWSDGLVMLALLWSVWISYVGVRTVFDAATWRARVLFLILPICAYALAGGVVVVAMLLAPLAPPSTRSPLTHAGANFSLQYPSNWAIDTTDPDYDPDWFIVVKAPQDAGMRIMFYEGPTTVIEDVADAVRTIKAGLDNPRVSPAPDTWGPYTGKSAMIRGSQSGTECACRIFVTEIRPNAFLQIQEITAASDLQRVEPGYQLIRNTLRAR